MHAWTIVSVLSAGFDEVAIEGDVDVDVVAVDGVLPLPLVQPDPHLIALLQLQHDALTLHDGAVAGLGVHDGLLLIVLHDVHIRLFEVPRVDVEVEEVDPRHAAGELPLEHVELLLQVDKHRVEHQRLVGLQAVEGFATAHGEGRVLRFAQASRGTRLTFAAFGARGSRGARGAIETGFARGSSVAAVAFVTCTRFASSQSGCCSVVVYYSQTPGGGAPPGAEAASF